MNVVKDLKSEIVHGFNDKPLLFVRQGNVLELSKWLNKDKEVSRLDLIHSAIIGEQCGVLLHLLETDVDAPDLNCLMTLGGAETWLDGSSALHLAAVFHPLSLSILLDHLAIQLDPSKFQESINSVNALNYTPLQLAVLANNTTSVSLLLEQCGEPNLDLIQLAVKNGAVEALVVLLEHLDLTQLNSGASPIFLTSDKLIIEILLKNGATLIEPARRPSDTEEEAGQPLLEEDMDKWFSNLLNHNPESAKIVLDNMVQEAKDGKKGKLVVLDLSLFRYILKS